MRELDRRFGLVDLLTTRARRTARLVLQIPLVDPHLRVGGLREDGDGHRARMHTAALLIRRYTLPPVASRFVSEEFRSTSALRSEDEEAGALLDEIEVKDRVEQRASRTR